MSRGHLGAHLVGAPVLLLTVKGRKTGKTRTTPLMYLSDETKIVIVASKGGDQMHPAWYLNLHANPEVSVQIGKEKSSMLATTATAKEKARLWPKLVMMFKPYAEYQANTSRDIPVVLLSKR